MMAPTLPSPPPPPTDGSADKNPAALPWYVAVWHALRSRDLDFYPRVKDATGTIISLDTRAMVKEFNEAAQDWAKLKADDLDEAIKLARQSLDESKDQTEYQDQKATRLLTVTTFLTALSGALFTRFNDTYPFGTLWDRSCWATGLLVLGYAVFGLFLLTALAGALVTFHATRTRFKYPKQESAAREAGDPNSRLFYSGVISIRPKAWASTFVGTPASGIDPTPRHDIVQAYYRDLVGETYLVAAKTADKLRYLEPAQSLLSASLKCLLLWLFLLPFIAVAVDPKKAVHPPLHVDVSASGKPIRIETVSAPLPAAVPALGPAKVQVGKMPNPKAATPPAGTVSARQSGHE
ncbi:hypothetical protein PX699_02460 [Sphingobium sp. H39-3-25]|uniref:hypothetical protein n=1 Tax=Sphingobium arseniciresistens TaxID=3030834 RepID=UPI0023B9AAA9|nr:hypothetical protein [Sphingobium arseniciresistens]